MPSIYIKDNDHNDYDSRSVNVPSRRAEADKRGHVPNLASLKYLRNQANDPLDSERSELSILSVVPLMSRKPRTRNAHAVSID